MDGMVENTYLQESLELLSQEAAGWSKERGNRREKMLENSKSQMKQAVNDADRQLKIAETVLEMIHLPALFRDTGRTAIGIRQKERIGKWRPPRL